MTTRATRAVLAVAVLYLAAGLGFAALAGQAGSIGTRNAWRLAAWIVSAAAFGWHIVYEHVVLGSTARNGAFHVALGAALGAFGLAAAANIHALNVAPHRPPLLLVLSLGVWPIMTALPAFVVAWIATALLARIRRAPGASM